MLDIGLEIHGLSVDNLEALSSGPYASAVASAGQIDTSCFSLCTTAQLKNWMESGLLMRSSKVIKRLPLFLDFIPELCQHGIKGSLPASQCPALDGIRIWVELKKVALVNHLSSPAQV